MITIQYPDPAKAPDAAFQQSVLAAFMTEAPRLAKAQRTVVHSALPDGGHEYRVDISWLHDMQVAVLDGVTFVGEELKARGFKTSTMARRFTPQGDYVSLEVRSSAPGLT